MASQRIASVKTRGDLVTTTYYHSDHLGSSNVLTDQNGNQVALYEYSPYGETVTSNPGTLDPSTPYLFTGKELDDSTGLYFYGARYYDPEIGRFITPDSIVQAPSDPQSLNRYSYCRNNPLNLVDPTGNGFWGIFFAIVKFILASTAASYAASGIIQAANLNGWAARLVSATFAVAGTALGLGITNPALITKESLIAAGSTDLFLTSEPGQRMVQGIAAGLENFGMSSRVAQVFGTVFANITVRTGLEIGIPLLEGKKLVSVKDFEKLSSAQQEEFQDMVKEGKGVFIGGIPKVNQEGNLIKAEGVSYKAILHGNKIVGAAQMNKAWGVGQHIGAIFNNLNQNIDLGYPTLDSKNFYGITFVCHQSSAVSGLKAGFIAPPIIFKGNIYDTIFTTFVYGNYGGGSIQTTYEVLKDD